ncbi:hypothetical protein HNY73_017046 [Argiope bruennichi]|uniref:Uncharacterized protein n=1 Tax=Argiope bruennichi TaxID=94029 RepID=A0A8T0EKC9_ARGBR|nr:hypothetical protein HNY73_017046 [Argiope bruennichi]
MDLQQSQGDSSEKVTRHKKLKQPQRPISPASVEVTDEFIAEHSLEVTQAISLKETWATGPKRLAAATSEDQHPKSRRRYSSLCSDSFEDIDDKWKKESDCELLTETLPREPEPEPKLIERKKLKIYDMPKSTVTSKYIDFKIQTFIDDKSELSLQILIRKGNKK